MKRKIPGIIAFVILFQTVGYFIVFEIRQVIIHEAVKEKIESNLPESELVVFKIPVKDDNKINSGLQRVNKKEFCYHNMMYDIVRQEQSSDTIRYYCLSDEKETALFSDLNRIIRQQEDSNPNQKNQQKQHERFFSLLYDFQFNGYHQLFIGHQELLYNYIDEVVCFIPNTIKPPPKHKQKHK